MYGYEKIFQYLSSRGANQALRNHKGVAARDAEEPTAAKPATSKGAARIRADSGISRSWRRVDEPSPNQRRLS